MCIVSEKTIKSWWVPYEIGYAKKSAKELATLKLKGDVYIPHFLEITKILKGTMSLNSYIHSISGKPILESKGIFLDSVLSHKIPNHPLNNYLDWNQ
ncbi:MAG: hypothetical protein RLZ75_3065 [Pseudomonadota bacterium]|jgi:hypothetical protein